MAFVVGPEAKDPKVEANGSNAMFNPRIPKSTRHCWRNQNLVLDIFGKSQQPKSHVQLLSINPYLVSSSIHCTGTGVL